MKPVRPFRDEPAGQTGNRVEIPRALGSAQGCFEEYAGGTVLDLLDSWLVHLRAERKSARTVTVYRAGVEQYGEYCRANGLPEVIDRNQVRAWLAHLMDSGFAPATADIRLTAVKQYAAWLVTEDELDSDPIVQLKAPKIGEKVVRPLSADEIKALLATCRGKDLMPRRDEAIIRLLLNSGLRASELCGLRVPDVKVATGTALVQGKGDRERVVEFNAQTARALDRWLRVRRTHPKAGTSALWLGGMGRSFGYGGLHQMLTARGLQAGIEGLHPHLLRHTWASRRKDAGLSEQSLMTLAGWRSPRMLRRYTQYADAERAIAESRRLDVDGDL
ncbi:tyrosine-type recombinase/integrase [Kribbella aluminosa]